MTKHPWLVLIAAAAAAAGCSNGGSVNRRMSVVMLSDPYDSTVAPLSLPDTVHRGAPFTVTFVTVYPSSICWKPDGETIATIGRRTRITPWEAWVLPAGQAGPCDLLQVGERSTTVTLLTTGVDTIRVVGRVPPYSTPDNSALDSVSASVVVVP